jgi:hypothetical protein
VFAQHIARTNTTFKINTEQLPFSAAHDWCREDGGWLVSYFSADEQVGAVIAWQLLQR